MKKSRLILLSVLAGLGLSACSTIKVPKMDFIKFPEFREEAENIGDYPKVEDAPETPTGLRSDAQWDQAAKNVMAKRDDFGEVPAPSNAMTDTEIENEINALATKVEEYKLDDPQ